MQVDINKFRSETSRVNGTPKYLPRPKNGGWFIKGPIPGDWIGQAAALPGKSLHVALAVWTEASMKKRRTAVPISSRVFARFGVGKDAGRLGLNKLEAAGLIRVERHSGRCPRVDILETK